MSAEKREADTVEIDVTELLLQSISKGDTENFYRALAMGADVNCDGGKPLQLAAEADNQLFLRDLVIEGADIPYAVAGLKKEQKDIARVYKPDSLKVHTLVFKTREGQKRHDQAGRLVKRLEAYEKYFVNTVSKIESVRLQNQILNELQELKWLMTGGPSQDNEQKPQKPRINF